MSHMKVLVIGPNVEEQLAPYDEGLEVEPYRSEDTDAEARSMIADAREYYGGAAGFPPGLSAESTDLQILRAFTEEDWREGEDGKLERWTTYNPKSKWDWYVTGGRYGGFFRHLPNADPADITADEGAGLTASVIRRRAIDFEAMKADAVKADADDWAKHDYATRGIEPPKQSLEQLGDSLRASLPDSVSDDEVWQKARAAWAQDPWVSAMREAGYYFNAYGTFRMDAEDPRAATRRDAEAFATGGFYAVVKDGEWTARGDMGWFGISSNETMTATEWYLEVAELIEALPEDTLLTVVDCHI